MLTTESVDIFDDYNGAVLFFYFYEFRTVVDLRESGSMGHYSLSLSRDMEKSTRSSRELNFKYTFSVLHQEKNNIDPLLAF